MGEPIKPQSDLLLLPRQVHCRAGFRWSPLLVSLLLHGCLALVLCLPFKIGTTEDDRAAIIDTRVSAHFEEDTEVYLTLDDGPSMTRYGAGGAVASPGTGSLPPATVP